MRPQMRLVAACSSLALAVASSYAAASETQAFVYDELGRLVTVLYSGSVNNGQKHSICFDPSSNRTKYKSDAGGASATCPTPTPAPTPAPTPTPPPPPPNRVPVANTDAVVLKVCESKTAIVTANDSDPDGDPLSVVSVGTSIYAGTRIASASSVEVIAGGTPGSQAVSYTISDGRGGAATAQLNITVQTGTGCN